MVREVKAPTDWKLCPSSGAAGLGYPCGRLRNLVVYSPFATASGRYTLQLGDKPYAPCAPAPRTSGATSTGSGFCKKTRAVQARSCMSISRGAV